MAKLKLWFKELFIEPEVTTKKSSFPDIIPKEILPTNNLKED